MEEFDSFRLGLIKLGIDPTEYDKLSQEEQEAVREVLKDTSVGIDLSYEELYYSDYKEIPVDFITFITDDHYLGKATRHGEFLYPFWKKEIPKIFASGTNEVALSGCLSGDTLIPLMDGSRVPIKDLVGRKNFKVYSYDLNTNQFTAGNAVRAFSTGYKMTYRVFFDNGESIRITGNHKFLTRDKHYKSIDDGLTVGDSIMPFNYSIDERGYEHINHQIVAIHFNEIEEVFDIEVEKYHNFALEAGVVVHNSIGVGKSTASCLMIAYHLYKTMCMKDPQAFFDLAPGTKIVYAFLNNTLASSTSVGYGILQSFLIDSPWFLKHGAIEGRTEPHYVPEGNFAFVIGSRKQHTLGMAVICLTGDTQIITTDGVKSIEELEGKEIRVFSYNEEAGQLEKSQVCTVQKTGEVTELIEIELEDGSLIKCTPEHRFLLTNGQYKMAKDLTENDDNIVGIKVVHSRETTVMKIKKITKIKYDKPVAVYDVINAKPHHNFLIKGNTCNIVSHNCAMIDEVSFSVGQDANYAKSKIMDLYANIRGRMASRFTVQGKMYGLAILASSKSTENAFLEAYINDQLKKGYPIYVVDHPIWDIKPNAYSGETFKVAAGNKFLPSQIIANNVPEDQQQEICKKLEQEGLRVIDVPIELKQDFDTDIDKALQDLAGISTSIVTKAFDGTKIRACISETLTNPFTLDVISLGTKDTLQLKDFFDPTRIPEEMFGVPCFIHLDASVSGDRTGLSCVGIAGTKVIETPTDNDDYQEMNAELIYQQIFSIGIQAPPGAQISFEKTRQFIYYLRDELGLKIKQVTTDGFQSVDFRQILDTKGFNVGYTSLDRTPDGYDGLLSAINDKRIVLLQNTETLCTELADLERDNRTRKYDHPIYSCFTGDTKIRLVDGRSLTIEELLREQEYKENWVYTVNEKTQKIEPKKIQKVYQTKLTTDLVRVTFDNGECVMCTPDHRFMLRDGSYEEIQNLSPGVSLMSLYTKVTDISSLKGYHLYYEPIENKWHYEHRSFCNKGSGKIVHHRNYNKSDKIPEGFVRGRCKVGKNHKIVSIERIHKPCRVYDLTIEDNHNFALDAGVFVHNSKDIADSLAGAFLDALKYRDEYLFYNPANFDYENINCDIDDKQTIMDDMMQNLLGISAGAYINTVPEIEADGVFNSDFSQEFLQQNIALPGDDSLLI